MINDTLIKELKFNDDNDLRKKAEKSSHPYRRKYTIEKLMEQAPEELIEEVLAVLELLVM